MKDRVTDEPYYYPAHSPLGPLHPNLAASIGQPLQEVPTKNPSMSDISPASATARANLAIADELGRTRWP